MVPKEGRLVVAELVRALGTNLKARLAQADALPADADVTLGDIVECDFDGYAAINLDDFPAATIDGGDNAAMLSPLKTWTAGAGITGPQTIFMLYVTAFNTSTLATKLLFFERLSPTVTLAAVGETFQRYVRWRDTNYAP